MRQSFSKLSALCMFLVAAIVGAFVSLQTAAAQDDQDRSPLIITAQLSTDPGPDCNTGNALVAQLRYGGLLPLRGYLAVLTLADSATGKVVQEKFIQEIRDSREAMFASGADWTRKICLSRKTIAGRRPRVSLFPAL